jgi:hypothetical protein
VLFGGFDILEVQKAVEPLKHAVVVQEKVLAEERSSRLASQHELAIAYRADGQVQKAVEHVVTVKCKSDDSLRRPSFAAGIARRVADLYAQLSVNRELT